MLCHLSALIGFIIPFGNILGPLLVWQIKKDEIPSAHFIGKAALNFQITVVIALLAGIAVAVVLSFFCVGFLLIPVVMLIGLAGLVLRHHRRHQGQQRRGLQIPVQPRTGSDTLRPDATEVKGYSDF